MQLPPDLIGSVPHRLQEVTIIGQDVAEMRVFMPGLPPELDQDPQSVPGQRLGLGQPAGLPQQCGQVIEAGGDVGVVGP